ncbi:Ntn hydrolase family protein [Rhodovarius crocodyli]|uniref:hypothetical protein n=1 Tax=Rhodovarius crocodyli TaxID=1979269 RepID=UPI0013E2B1BB|nr:hypothetical protein [Rhodovarius crocodyli]
MTIIVSLRTPDGVVVGADSCLSDESGNRNRSRLPKLFRIGAVLIGYAGDARLGEVLRYQLQLAERHPKTDAAAWISTVVAPAIRQVAVDHHLVAEAADLLPGTLLLVTDGRAFILHSDYGVSEPVERYAAIGSGERLAVGALHGLLHLGIELDDPEAAIKAALSAAAEHDVGCMAPFTVERG